MMKEIKYLRDYFVTNTGQVFSKRRGGLKELRQSKTCKGYKTVMTMNNNGGYSPKLVHRLVASAYLLNPKQKPQVNHKDGNKTNNNIDNLEWATQSENLKHDFRVLGRIPSKPWLGKKGKLAPRTIRVGAFTKMGNLFKIFDTLQEGADFIGVTQCAVSNCLHGRANTSGGYIWRKV